MKISVIIGILTFITVNVFAVNQKQQYEIVGGKTPIVESEWSVKGVVKNTAGGVTLTLTSFVEKKFYLQYVAAANKLYLVFDLSQYPSEIIVNYPIEVQLTWTDPVTGIAYSASNTYVAGNKSTQNSNIFWVKDNQGLELKAPAPTMKVDNVTLCDGATGTTKATLTNAPAGYTINWGDTHVTTDGTPTNTQANAKIAAGLSVGAHNLTAKLMDGTTEVASANYTVTVKALPTVSITPTEVCEGQKITASGGVKYTWTKGGTGTSAQITPSASGEYVVNVEDANKCTKEGKANITVNRLPSVNIVPAKTDVCVGENISLTANASGGSGTYPTYTWNNGVSGNATGTKKAVAGDNKVKVSVTDSKGCTSALSNEVNVVGHEVRATIADIAPCKEDVGTLSANVTFIPNNGQGNVTYRWEPAADVVGQNDKSSVQVKAYGAVGEHEFTLTVTDGHGCHVEATGKVKPRDCTQPQPLAVKPPTTTPTGLKGEPIPACVTVEGGQCNSNYGVRRIQVLRLLLRHQDVLM